jgi:hypothetical protein
VILHGRQDNCLFWGEYSEDQPRPGRIWMDRCVVVYEGNQERPRRCWSGAKTFVKMDEPEAPAPIPLYYGPTGANPYSIRASFDPRTGQITVETS